MPQTISWRKKLVVEDEWVRFVHEAKVGYHRLRLGNGHYSCFNSSRTWKMILADRYGTVLGESEVCARRLVWAKVEAIDWATKLQANLPLPVQLALKEAEVARARDSLAYAQRALAVSEAELAKFKKEHSQPASVLSIVKQPAP